MAARDVAFTKLTTKNGNLSTQLIHQDDQITTLQAELCNLKVASETPKIEVKVKNKAGKPYARKKNRNRSGQLI